MNTVNSYAFVVDTDTLGDHFSQHLCAYVTAQRASDAGVMSSWAAQDAQQRLRHIGWYGEHVVHIDDEDTEDSTERPAAPWPTPGRFYDGYGKYHDDTPAVRAALDPRCAASTHPAFESVAIFIDELPPQQVLDEMVKHAKLFCQNNDIAYKGYRLLAPRFEMRPVCVGHDEVRCG